MKTLFPDYKHSLLNLMASIRKFFGCPSKHPSLDNVDELLNSGKYRTIVLILMDGMGTKIIDKHLSKDSFMKTHLIDEISSTFPSTTTAATTTVRTGESPIDNGWLGWHQYLDNVNDEVIMFLGLGYYTENKYDKKIGYEAVPYQTIFEKIQEKGFKADEFFPSWGEQNPTNSFNKMINKILKYSKSGNDKQYLYAYWDQPDHDMHIYGTMHKKVNKQMKQYDSLFKKLEKNLPEDALCFVVADHGHIDVDRINLANYPDFLDTISRLPSIETRNASFFIQDGKEDEFLKLFNKYFGDKFTLLTKKEVLDKELFGPNPESDKHFHFLGDYQAIAIDKYYFAYDPENKYPISLANHAGIVEDEMLVPLIKIAKK